MKNEGVEQSQTGIMENKVSSTSTLKPVLPLSPPWLELPEDVTAKILHKLGPVWILCAAQYVCTPWRKICRDPTMWRVIDMWMLGYDHIFYDKEQLCRHAVDLSQGEVMEINIKCFGPIDLLDYISERCGRLKCLRLAFRKDVSGKTLSRAVKGFPLLEELRLDCTPVDTDVIEAIGQSCPLLKTFAMSQVCVGYVYQKINDDALAIAKFMPELRHLRLLGNWMTNDALEAILIGCPKLESLDLRKCLNLNLEAELGKRCAQQIGIFWGPDDPIDDYEWRALVLLWTEVNSVSYRYDFEFADDDFRWK